MLNSGLQGSEDKRGRKTNSTACDQNGLPSVTQLILSGLTETLLPVGVKASEGQRRAARSHQDGQAGHIGAHPHTLPHVHKPRRTSHIHAHMYSHTRIHTVHMQAQVHAHTRKHVCTHAHTCSHTCTNIHPRPCILRSTITELEDLPTCLP